MFRKIEPSAQRIGISERCLWDWIKKGLPYYKIGKLAFVRDEDVDVFIERHRVAPKDEVNTIIDELMKGNG